MNIILDANVLMSALIKDSYTREFISKLDHNFFMPETVFETLLKYRGLILKKTNANPKDLDSLIKRLVGFVKVIKQNEYEGKLQIAEKTMRGIDIEDSVFVACALVVSDAVIWSDDKHLKKQNLVGVYTTKEILRLRL
jgi:predicted nucleic acid-binding protein